MHFAVDVEQELRQKKVQLEQQIKDMDKTIKCKDKTIKDMYNTIEDRDNTIEDMNKTIKDMDKTIEDRDKANERLQNERNHFRSTVEKVETALGISPLPHEDLRRHSTGNGPHHPYRKLTEPTSMNSTRRYR